MVDRRRFPQLSAATSADLGAGADEEHTSGEAGHFGAGDGDCGAV